MNKQNSSKHDLQVLKMIYVSIYWITIKLKSIIETVDAATF